jgi:hypothetical protein
MAMFARTAAGDWVLPLTIVTDVGTIAAQKCQDLLNLWQGAWFLNVLEGFPWLQKVLGRKIQASAVNTFRSLMRQTILQVPGVVSIIALQVTLGATNRQLSYTFQAALNNGQILTGGSGIPFIVTGSASS